MKPLFKKTISIVLILLVLLFPFPISDGCTTTKYAAVLWSFQREYEVIQQDIGGISGRVKFYTIYKFRILFFPIEIKDTDNIKIGQW